MTSTNIKNILSAHNCQNFIISNLYYYNILDTCLRKSFAFSLANSTYLVIIHLKLLSQLLMEFCMMNLSLLLPLEYLLFVT